LAAVVSATALSTTAQAQQPSPPPADELQAARERLKTNGDLLAQQQVPVSTEPAFQFKV
jgi:hypothetical protein